MRTDTLDELLDLIDDDLKSDSPNADDLWLYVRKESSFNDVSYQSFTETYASRANW